MIKQIKVLALELFEKDEIEQQKKIVLTFPCLP
jgi:hypothetical protein